LIVIAAFLMAMLGYFRWDSLIGLAIIAVWVSAIALRSRRALQAARRLNSPLERVRSWHPATRAVLAISIGVGAVVIGKVINR
jgi:hypothetical protein